MIVCQLHEMTPKPDTCLFPDEIENDPWVIYHGTSGCKQDVIEREGFSWNPNGASKEQIQRVVTVYRQMSWYGADSSGFAALEPFSLEHDFGENSASPVYFAETSKRALLYASQDYAGGEKNRLLRNSIRHLQRYLVEPELRNEHYLMMKNEYDYLVSVSAINAESSKPVNVDLSWLRSEIALLSDIQDLAEDAYSNHVVGVVYAVKMDANDLAGLELHPSMGIKAHYPIAASKIAGKLIIPLDYRHQGYRNSDDTLRLMGVDGVYSRLRLPKRAG